ncbi:MAG: DUF952 domain-containing protein [Fuerstiella sp.]
MSTIYKIMSEAEWVKAKADGEFAGAEIDLADGYIHFSTAQQVRETAAKHFANRADLVLLSVNSDGLGAAIKWEPSRGGDLFPHLYGNLIVGDVALVDALPLSESGEHVFPEHVAR